MLSAQQPDIGYFEGDSESFIYFSHLNVRRLVSQPPCTISAQCTYCQVIYSAYFRKQSVNEMTCCLKVSLPLSCRGGRELREAAYTRLLPVQITRAGWEESCPTEEQSARNGWWLLRAAVISYPSSALNLSLWLFKWQYQVVLPFSGQDDGTEALALCLLFESWNIQSKVACFN